MKKILLTLLWGTCFFVVQAQEELLKLQAETRIDYQREYVDGRSIHSNSGFKGHYQRNYRKTVFLFLQATSKQSSLGPKFF